MPEKPIPIEISKGFVSDEQLAQCGEMAKAISDRFKEYCSQPYADSRDAIQNKIIEELREENRRLWSKLSMYESRY